MPSTYATAFAAHHARGSTLSPRDTMVHPDDTTARRRPTARRLTMVRRPTMVRRLTMVRPGDTMVRNKGFPRPRPFAPYHGWLRRGSRFATAIERPQGPDTLLTSLRYLLNSKPRPHP